MEGSLESRILGFHIVESDWHVPEMQKRCIGREHSQDLNLSNIFNLKRDVSDMTGTSVTFPHHCKCYSSTKDPVPRMHPHWFYRYGNHAL